MGHLGTRFSPLQSSRLSKHLSLALIGSGSARIAGEQWGARAEALSIRRLEGRRWRGGSGRGGLWRLIRFSFEISSLKTMLVTLGEPD